MANGSNEVPLLVVLGATGSQGTAVLKYFAAIKTEQMRLRGITRDTNSDASQELVALGVEMVQGDLSDETSLRRAFNGATYIFATTDSNRLIFSAIKQPDLLSEGQTPRSYAREAELGYGRNIASAAAATSNLKRIIWSGLASPSKWSNGKYTKVTMFDTKEDIADMLHSTPELRDKLSVVLIGFYATNALNVPVLYGPQKQAYGTYELSLPMSGGVPVPMADLDASLGEWVNALCQADPGLTLVGATSIMSWKQWLEVWAKQNQVSASYRRASPDEYAGRIPGISDAVAEEFAFLEEFGFSGAMEGVVYPEDASNSVHVVYRPALTIFQLRKRGHEIGVHTIEEHVRRCDWSSLL